MCNGTKDKKYWIGSINVCQICNNPFAGDIMFDANVHGQWGNICSFCFHGNGCQLGIGFGQKYKLDRDDGKWYLVAGDKEHKSDLA